MKRFDTATLTLRPRHFLMLPLLAACGGVDAEVTTDRHEVGTTPGAATGQATVVPHAEQATFCGFHEYKKDDGSVGYLPRVAYFGAMNRQLARQPELVRRLGFDNVETCEQAEHFLPVADLYATELDEPEQIPAPTNVQRGEVEKIFNGVDSSRKAVIALTFWGRGASWNCTGILVSPQHVITAAHCLMGRVSHTVTMRANTTTTNPSEWTGFAFAYVHPDFTGSLAASGGTSSDTHDDIGMLSLSRAWTYSLPANRVRLWEDHTAVGQILNVYGHGATTDTSGASPTLKQPPGGAQLDIDWHTGSGYFIMDATNTARVCKGDSGGPAIREDQSAYVAYGIASSVDGVSDTNQCPNNGAKQRWAKISPKVPWFEQTMRFNPNYGPNFSCQHKNDGWGNYAQCWAG